MPSCPYFIFYWHLYLQTCGHIFWFRLLLEDKRGLSLGELIRPFCIMLLYQYLLHYGLLLHIMSQYLCLFSLILQGLHKEGECRLLGFWAGKGANIRDLFCTAPKVLKLHGRCFQNIYIKYSAKEIHQGGHTLPMRVGARPTPWAPPYLMGPLVALWCPSSAIWSLSMRKKS